MTKNTEGPEDTPKMILSNGLIAQILASKALVVLEIIFLLALGVYLAFSLTVLRAVPTFSGVGFTVVKNLNYEGGIIPTDGENKETILIDTASTHDGGIVDNIKTGFIPNNNTALIEVYAGPAGKVKWVKPDIVSVDDKQIPGSLEAVEPTDTNPQGNPIPTLKKLQNSYAGVCVSGACEEGTVVFFPQENVIGVPIFGAGAK